MALSIGELVGYVRLDTDGLRRGLAKAGDAMRRAGRQIDGMGDSIAKVGNVWAKTSDKFVIASGLVHATAATHALVGALGVASGALLALPAAGALAGGAFATIKVGLIGVSDAFKALGEDQEKFEEAIAGLAPAAQSFMRNLRGMRDEGDALRDSVQGRMFAGLTAETNALASAYLPLLTRGMGRVATSLNGMTREASAAVQTPFFKGVVRQVFRTTAKAGDSLTGAVKPLVKIMGALVRAGAPYIAQGVKLLSTWVKTKVAAKSAGEWVAYFRDKITDGLDALKSFGRSARNIRDALSNLFADSALSPDRMVAGIERLSGAFLKWTQNADNVRNVNQILDALARILPALAGAAGPILKVFGRIAETFNDLPKPVQDIIINVLAVGLVFGRLLKVLGPVIKFLGKLGKPLKMLGKGFAKVVPWILRAGKFLLRFLGPIGLAITAVLAIVTAIKKWDKIKAIAKRVWTAVKKWTVETWKKVKAKVRDGIDKVKSTVSGGFDKVTGWAKKLPGRITGALRSLKGKLRDLFGGAMSAARDKVVGIGGRIRDWIAGIPGKLRSLGSRFGDAGRAILQRFIDGMKNAAGIISGIAGNVWDAVRGLLNGAIGRINSALEFTIKLPGPNLTINPPNIPALASGGRVTGETIARIGEREPETVLRDRDILALLGKAHRAGQESVAGADTGRQVPLIGKVVQAPGESTDVLAERLWFNTRKRG